MQIAPSRNAENSAGALLLVPTESPPLPAMSAAAMPGAEGKPDPAAVREMVREATAWCAMHGLVVGDRANPVKFFGFSDSWRSRAR